MASDKESLLSSLFVIMVMKIDTLCRLPSRPSYVPSPQPLPERPS